MSKIERVDLTAFTFEVPDLSLGGHAAAGVGNLIFSAGSLLTVTRYALRLRCDDGS